MDRLFFDSNFNYTYYDCGAKHMRTRAYHPEYGMVYEIRPGKYVDGIYYVHGFSVGDFRGSYIGWVLMMDTKATDVDDQPIYEGDVVKTDNGHLFSVHYYPKFLRFVGKPIDHEIDEDFDVSRCKVVSNVFEMGIELRIT